MIESKEKRRIGVKENMEIERKEWLGYEKLERKEDNWKKKWEEEYMKFEEGEMRKWMNRIGMRWFKVVGWEERGGRNENGKGN